MSKLTKDIYWHNNLEHSVEAKHTYTITLSLARDDCTQPNKDLIDAIIRCLSDTYPDGCNMKFETTVEATETIEEDGGLF